MTQRPGDWYCPSCNDLQFARNTNCRQCGTEKPDDVGGPVGGGAIVGGMVGGGSTPRAEDWTCPACGDLVFGKNAACRMCGTPRPGGGGKGGGGKASVGGKSGGKEGDWTCSNCGDLVFARNASCRMCGTSKPAAASNGQMMKDGDWICPNCGDLVFARNDNCRKCGSPRTGGYGKGKGASAYAPIKGASKGFPVHGSAPYPTSKPTAQVQMQGDWICPACGDLVFGRNDACRRCGSPRAGTTSWGKGGAGGKAMNQAMMQRTFASILASFGKGDGKSKGGKDGGKPGDWTCPNCGDLVFARNDACRQCGTEKPAFASNGQGMKAGDWLCPACGDMQFARNEACRQCGTPKPADDGSSAYPEASLFEKKKGGGKGGKPGDWNCPNCNDLQFARNSECRKCGTPKPEEEV